MITSRVVVLGNRIATEATETLKLGSRIDTVNPVSIRSTGNAMRALVKEKDLEVERHLPDIKITPIVNECSIPEV